MSSDYFQHIEDPLKHLGTTGAFNWAPIIPRGASLLKSLLRLFVVELLLFEDNLKITKKLGKKQNE